MVQESGVSESELLNSAVPRAVEIAFHTEQDLGTPMNSTGQASIGHRRSSLAALVPALNARKIRLREARGGNECCILFYREIVEWLYVEKPGYGEVVGDERGEAVRRDE